MTDTEELTVDLFWEDHVEKSKNEYNPYEYVWDMVEDEILIDYEWLEED